MVVGIALSKLGNTMIEARPTTPPARRTEPLGRLRIWHLALLVLFVAVAIVNIQDQRRSEPALIVLACAGFLGYGLLGWLGWRTARRFEARLGMMPLLILYLVAMAGLFLLATVVYLAIEHVYLVG
jgi:hypothetical protein